jgi:hypothetical protein
MSRDIIPASETSVWQVAGSKNTQTDELKTISYTGIFMLIN